VDHAREIWLVRHGETAWSRIGKHTGRSDIPLTEEGERQARAVGACLGGRRFGQVLVSPLRRARDTCELAGYAPVARVVPDLAEWDYGAYEQRLTAEVREEIPGWTIWTHGVVGGETIEDVATRARRVLAAVEAGEGDAILFAHGHLLRVLTACWIGLPPATGGAFALGPGSVSVLGYETERRVVRRWNLAPPRVLRSDERSTASAR
jgi:broad specificity phosphatase PhoE